MAHTALTSKSLPSQFFGALAGRSANDLVSCVIHDVENALNARHKAVPIRDGRWPRAKGFHFLLMAYVNSLYSSSTVYTSPSSIKYAAPFREAYARCETACDKERPPRIQVKAVHEDMFAQETPVKVILPATVHHGGQYEVGYMCWMK